ncbi:MAG: 23S rRNA (pseudouridine(1915)-N(3))-methyltransferase RlmH [Campylobacterales bacterium]|nr:23S rRNA (pseudouridine(1915)-N(3))-methyltransferase RlmH [Campylobacterales bacterium]
MRVRIFTIEKNEDADIESMLLDYQKMVKKFGSLEFVRLFDKTLAASQKQGVDAAKESYEKVYEPYFENAYNIALDEEGKNMDSAAFSKIFDKHAQINFFIGGAYGFNDSFLKKADSVISLSALTFSHKLAKLVLAEQVFRGLAIKNNHPYHK